MQAAEFIIKISPWSSCILCNYLFINSVYLFIKYDPGFQHCGTSGTGWLKTGQAFHIQIYQFSSLVLKIELNYLIYWTLFSCNISSFKAIANSKVKLNEQMIKKWSLLVFGIGLSKVLIFQVLRQQQPSLFLIVKSRINLLLLPLRTRNSGNNYKKRDIKKKIKGLNQK